MNESTHTHHEQGPHLHNVHRPYWKRAHRDWRFWVAVLFVFGALTVYVMSDDLALIPRSQPAQPQPAGPAGK
jgi:hypothetical protein